MTVRSPWMLPQSRKDSLPPDAKTYTISKPRFHQAHPHHITIAGQKNQMCMKRAWLAFPGHVQCFGARPFRETPLKHFRQQSVFTLCPKPNPPVIARATGRYLKSNQRERYIYVYISSVSGGLLSSVGRVDGNLYHPLETQNTHHQTLAHNSTFT